MDISARIPLRSMPSQLRVSTHSLSDIDFSQAEFRSLNNSLWKDKSGRHIGEVRAAGTYGGTKAGNLTWLRVYEAGHMVPHDQPEIALEFITK